MLFRLRKLEIVTQTGYCPGAWAGSPCSPQPPGSSWRTSRWARASRFEGSADRLLLPRGMLLEQVPHDRVLRRLHLVDTPYRAGGRGGLDDVGLVLGLARDRKQSVRERVERLLRLRLGRLDHQCLWHDQGEVDRRWMEPVVHQPLRDVVGRD